MVPINSSLPSQQSNLDPDIYSWMMASSDPFQGGHPSQPVSLAFPPTEPAVPVKVEKTPAPTKSTAGTKRKGSMTSSKRPAASTKRSTATKRGRKSQAIPDIPEGAKIEIIQTVQVGAAKLKKSDPNYEKKLRRLLRNRQVARDCRKRKREKMEQLEDEVVRLREWNRQLEIKLNQGKEGIEKEDARQRDLKKLRTLLQSRRSETEIHQALEQFTNSYADFGKERQAAVAFHLRQLKSLLTPTQVCKMTLWSLQQQEEFYNENENQHTVGGGIWNMISSNCQLTEEQKKQLTSTENRVNIRQQRDSITTSLHCLDNLEQIVQSNFSTLEGQFANIRAVASPSQQARFLLWIEDNQACMHMLNNLWAQRDDSVLNAIPKTPYSPSSSCSDASSFCSTDQTIDGQHPYDLDLADPLDEEGNFVVQNGDSIDVDEGLLSYLSASPAPTLF